MRGGELELLRGARARPPSAAGRSQTPDDFVFDVKLHRLLSRHAAQLQELPPDLRDGVEVEPARPRELTDELEAALIDRAEARRGAARPGRQAARLPAPAHARVRAPARTSWTSSTRCSSALAPHPVAVEFRHRGWVRGDARRADAGYLSEHARRVRRRGRAAGDHIPIMPRDRRGHPRRPGLPAPARPQRRGLPARQVRGRALRLALLATRSSRSRRARARPGRAGG